LIGRLAKSCEWFSGKTSTTVTSETTNNTAIIFMINKKDIADASQARETKGNGINITHKFAK